MTYDYKDALTATYKVELDKTIEELTMPDGSHVTLVKQSQSKKFLAGIVDKSNSRPPYRYSLTELPEGEQGSYALNITKPDGKGLT